MYVPPCRKVNAGDTSASPARRFLIIACVTASILVSVPLSWGQGAGTDPSIWGPAGTAPPEIVAKLSRLSEEQRKRLIYEMNLMRKRGASSEERRQVFVRKVDRALQERR